MSSFTDSGSENSEAGIEITDSQAAINPAGVVDKALIRRALNDILQSPPFRTSKQCQQLLRYIVRHSMAGNEDLLRERVIGSEVFGRKPDYDTANDPIVRARVAEVRKRLAQYYITENHGNFPIRFEIPSGSYRARFEAHQETSQEAQERPKFVPESQLPTTDVVLATTSSSPDGHTTHWNRLSRLWPWTAVAILVLGCIIFLLLHPIYSRQEAALRQFWGPAMQSPMPILIYTGTNVVYRFTPEFLEKYRQERHLENKGPEFVVDLKSLPKLDPRDLSSSPNAYVTVGDVSACASIVSMLARHNKAYELRYAGDISSGDLRSAPTVLIGAFNNNWTLNVTEPLRFAFVRGDTIEDRQDKTRSWSVHLKPDGSTTDDYAIVTRLLNSKNGSILMTAAGIGQYGTQAASEYLSNPQRIADFAQRAPRGWEKKNTQIVLHIKVVDEIPEIMETTAVHYW